MSAGAAAEDLASLAAGLKFFSIPTGLSLNHHRMIARSKKTAKLSDTVFLCCSFPPTRKCSGTCQHDRCFHLVAGSCFDITGRSNVALFIKLQSTGRLSSAHLHQGCIEGGRPTPAGLPCCRSPEGSSGSGRGWPE